VDFYCKNYNVDLDSDINVLPLLGTKEGIFHLPLAYVNPGEVILVPDPGYVTYTRGGVVAGAVISYFGLNPDNNYQPNFNEIPDKVADRARLMWLNYPNNPTGATASISLFERAVDFAKKHNIIICHDAAYSQVIFGDGISPSILQVPDAESVAVEFNSLSKSHNMAGWRVGVVVGNARVINSLYILKTNADSGHFLPVMDAAATALSGDQSWIKQRNSIYRKRRDIVIDAMREMGFDVKKSDASIYVWCPIPEGWSSEDFSQAALENAWVSVTPGTVFGLNGEGYIRISLTAPESQIKLAMVRLHNWLLKEEKVCD
jgi:LL-diaminopimelate aminotransferase